MTVPAEQAEIAALLTRLAGAPPIETHISAVFIGADTVWKLKQAVVFPYLDFSTVAAREKFCRRELALNAAAAPGLYRDVVAVIRRPDGQLELGGEGVAIDWVLRMARVPDADGMDRIARDGRLDAGMQDAVADAVAAYHRALAPVRRCGTSQRLAAALHGNVAAARSAGLDPARVAAWRASIVPRLAAIADWLDLRADQGFVRRAHGDLHLGNLCLWQGRPVPFDALEFDEDLATIDLGYDLAFLLMDIERAVGRPAANRVLNRYVARTGDAALLRGLAVFLSLRAMIRSLVAASRRQAGPSRDYLDRAMGYLAAAAPMVVAIGGLPGSGKSTLARALAPVLGLSPGALILRADEVRKRQHGVAPEQRLPPSAYAPTPSRRVFEEILAQASHAASGRHAVIVDATLTDPGQQARLAGIAAAAGLPFIGIWLQAPAAVLEARIAARRGDASDATVAVLRGFAAVPPPAGWHRIDAEDADAALAAARRAIGRRRSQRAADVLG